MTSSSLRGARVALLYSPGNLGVDYAASLLRGIERGFLDLGARVATLNLALYRRSIVTLAHELGPDGVYPPDAPLTRGCIDFLRGTWPDAPFDLCLGVFHDLFLSDELADVLQRRVRHVVNYPLNLLDQPYRFVRTTRFCAETFCSEEEALAPLRAEFGETKIRYVPMAADPWIHRRLAVPQSPRVLFVGSLYASRELMLARCADELPVSIFGPNSGAKEVARGIAREALKHARFDGLPYAGRALRRALRRDDRVVGDEEFVRLASEHGVSVGFATVREEKTGRLRHKVRLREYEATMSGLCHLAMRLPELERGFVDGEEILLYEHEDEIQSILARIRSHQIDWRSIGAAARRRAARDHTWAVRLADAFNAPRPPEPPAP